MRRSLTIALLLVVLLASGCGNAAQRDSINDALADAQGLVDIPNMSVVSQDSCEPGEPFLKIEAPSASADDLARTEARFRDAGWQNGNRPDAQTLEMFNVSDPSRMVRLRKSLPADVTASLGLRLDDDENFTLNLVFVPSVCPHED